MLENKKYRWTITICLWISYLVLLIPVTWMIGGGSTMFLIIPTAITGAFFGSKTGVISGIIGVGYNGWILFLITDITMIVSHPFVIGSSLIILVGFLSGKLRDMNEKLVDEVKKRKKAQYSLDRSKKRVQELHNLSKDLHKAGSKEEIFRSIYRIIKNLIGDDLVYLDILEDGTSVKDRYDLPSDLINHHRMEQRYSDSIEEVVLGQDIIIRVELKNERSNYDHLDLIKLLGPHINESISRVKTEEEIGFLHSMLRHDLRNDLQIAKGYLQLVSEEDLTHDQQDYVERSIISIERGVDLVEKVRKMRTVGKDNTFDVELNKVMKNVIEYYEPEADKKNIEVEWDPKDSPLMVKANELLYEVFSNIISNCIIHSEGEKIHISRRVTPEEVICTIEDDGKGISDEDKTDIFKQGYRKGKNGGTGLGAYLAREIVESYEGSMEVKDSELDGTRFDVLLKRVGDQA